MATNLGITTAYAGEVYQEMLTLMATGFEAVDQGIINVVTDIKKTRVLPRFKIANIIQDHAVTPSSAGTSTYSERALTPLDFMIYYEFRPRDYEDLWMPFHPSGDQLMFRELAPEVQITMLGEIFKELGSYMGQAVFSGATSGGTAPYDKFNGIETRALADADVIDIASPVALSAANIVDKVKAVYDATPIAVRRDPNYKILLNVEAGEFYTDAIHNQTYKGADFTSMGPMTYKGKPVVPLVGISDDTIIGTRCGDTITSSNIHLGVDFNRESFGSAIQVEQLQNNSELYFAKMLMKADTQITWGEELVLYQA